MKGQTNTSVLPAGSLMIQSGQSMTQPLGAVANISAVQATSAPHQNLQVWTPGPGGAISVSGIGAPRGHPNIVTFPSGQTVLMSNLVTTASNQMVPLPVSSPLSRPPMQTSQVGSPIVLSTPTPPPLPAPLPTHHLAGSNVAMLRGLGGSISVALPSAMLPNSSLSVASTGVSNHYSVATSVVAQSDPVSQFADQSSIGHSSFSSGSLQALLPGTQVICDQSTLGVLSVKPQQDTSNIQPPTPLVSTYVSSQQQQQPPGSFLSELTSDITVSSAGDGIAVFNSDGTQPVANFGEFSHSLFDGSSSVSAVTMVQQSVGDPVNNNILVTTVPSTQPGVSQETLSTPTMSVFPVPDKPDANPTREEAVACEPTALTPVPLAQLFEDLDPQLQLDPEVKEVLVALANEFLTSVMSKAQKLSTHRSSSVVEAKDVHFCLDRDWDVNSPGYMPEDCSLKLSAISEAHKQRLALIKKQIKKM